MSLAPLGGPSAPWRPNLNRPGTSATTNSTSRTPTAGAYVPPHKNRPYGSPEATEYFIISLSFFLNRGFSSSTLFSF
jgi:hypothetical protein